VTKSKNPQKLTEQAVKRVEEGPSNIETYKEQHQNDEPVSSGLEFRTKDMRAFCQDWDVKWDIASKK
jgi:hypothetical protein